jgi:hypothetical protein
MKDGSENVLPLERDKAPELTTRRQNDGVTIVLG